MLDFSSQKSFTLVDIFHSVLQCGKNLLTETYPNQQGRLPHYLSTTRALCNQVKTKNFSPKKIGLLLDELDDGLSIKYPNEHPYALPLITNQTEKKFALIMLEHFEQAYQHRGKIDLSGYSIFIRGAIHMGLIWNLPNQAKVLRERVEQFEQQCSWLRMYGVGYENQTLSDQVLRQEPSYQKQKVKA